MSGDEEKKKSETAEEFVTKEMGRRAFIKLSGLGIVSAAAVTTLPSLLLQGCANAPKQAGGNPARRWGMIIDLKRCVACKACTVGCKNENKTPPGVAYNVFIEEERGIYPYVQRLAFTRPCMQCKHSSCSKVCPTGATYHRSDGIVAIDYEKCIGCRYCIAACPYGARSFDYGHDYVVVGGNTYNAIPSSEYGAKYGVRKKGKSPIGNVRKCTFCLHLQDEKGEYHDTPACARTCMGKAIHFGDLRNPEAMCVAHSEKMQKLLAGRSHFRLKEELGNEPSVYYLT